MRRGSVQADGAQDRSLSRPPRATGLLERCVICFASRRFLSIPMVVAVAVAATATSADTVRQGPAVALPFGDIIIPVPAPPTNADPMNPASPGDVVTQRYNNLRTGTTLHSGLDPSAVSVDSFGLVGKLDVDGVVLAQPLFVEGVEFPNKGRRPAVFIATSTNNVYAFDADTLDKLWQHQLGAPFSVDTFQPQLPPPPAPPQKFKSCKGNADTKDQCIDKCIGQLAVTEQEPRVATDGIQSTPVIDVAGSHIIVSYRTTDRKSDNLDVPEHGAQRIAALNLVDGQFAKGLDGRDLDRRVEDNLLWNEVHRNRASLLLDEGRVYVAFAGRCEIQLWKFGGLSFQGWIYAFDAATLAFEGRYRSTRQENGSASLEPTDDPIAGGGIWQASTGLAADGRGSLYFATGNQSTGFQSITHPVDPLGGNLPDSVVRLRIEPRPNSSAISMTPSDWFTPYRLAWLDVNDLDFAAAGVVLVPNTRYLVAAGKEGVLYVLDRDNLGKFDGSVPFDEKTVESHTSEDLVALNDARRDQVVQKFRIGENQYCAATSPNPVYCLGAGQSYPPPPTPPGRGVAMNQWPTWPHVHGTPVFGAFPDGRAFLYVWPEKDFLKSFRWWGKRFDTAPMIATKRESEHEKLLAPPYIANRPGATDNGALQFGMPGGFLSLAIDPAKPAAGVLFASVPRCAMWFVFDASRNAKLDAELRELHECEVQRCQDPTTQATNCGDQDFGMLRAFNPITMRELWNNQTDKFAEPEDKRYLFAKFVPPMIANGRVYLATGSKRVLVYGRH
jgi:hypothetical protein